MNPYFWKYILHLIERYIRANNISITFRWCSTINNDGCRLKRIVCKTFPLTVKLLSLLKTCSWKFKTCLWNHNRHLFDIPPSQFIIFMEYWRKSVKYTRSIIGGLSSKSLCFEQWVHVCFSRMPRGSGVDITSISGNKCIAMFIKAICLQSLKAVSD